MFQFAGTSEGVGVSTSNSLQSPIACPCVRVVHQPWSHLLTGSNLQRGLGHPTPGRFWRRSDPLTAPVKRDQYGEGGSVFVFLLVGKLTWKIHGHDPVTHGGEQLQGADVHPGLGGEGSTVQQQYGRRLGIAPRRKLLVKQLRLLQYSTNYKFGNSLKLTTVFASLLAVKHQLFKQKHITHQNNKGCLARGRRENNSIHLIGFHHFTSQNLKLCGVTQVTMPQLLQKTISCFDYVKSSQKQKIHNILYRLVVHI